MENNRQLRNYKLNDRLAKFVSDDEQRLLVQYVATYSILMLVAIVMTVLNVFTKKGALTWATGIFAILCAVNVLLHIKGGFWRTLTKYAFMAETLVLFTFFLISGNPEGFSAIWIVLLPSCAFLLYQIKEGSILTGCMWLILVFLLWTKPGNGLLQYEYSASFMQRFPVLYLAASVLALFLELIRQKTFENYTYLINHDPLTGALNRRGFFKFVDNELEKLDGENITFAMMDLDHFKDVNDKYGHDAGDEVLKQSVDRIKKLSGMEVCRWGGEEFVLFDRSGKLTKEFLENLCREFGNLVVNYNGHRIPVHISIGAVCADNSLFYNIVKLSQIADECLYEAKESGRNQSVYKVHSEAEAT